jgi:hypothetical protein
MIMVSLLAAVVGTDEGALPDEAGTDAAGPTVAGAAGVGVTVELLHAAPTKTTTARRPRSFLMILLPHMTRLSGDLLAESRWITECVLAS